MSGPVVCAWCRAADRDLFALVAGCKIAGHCKAPIPAVALPDRIKLQTAEFDACDELAKQMRRINLTPVVDDDYPEVRHGYEGALRAFLMACKDNGRTL